MSSRDMNELLDRVPIVQSAIAGLAAWVASFVVMAILVAGTEDGDDLVGFTGNVLYSSHFVESTVESPTITGGTESETQNLLSEGATELSEFVYYAVPIVVLLVAGIALVRFVEIREPDAAAIAGAASAIGYVVLTVVGTFVFEFNEDVTMGGQTVGEVSATPELGAMTIVVMGLLYPVVFGAIGGAIGSRL